MTDPSRLQRVDSYSWGVYAKINFYGLSTITHNQAIILEDIMDMRNIPFGTTNWSQIEATEHPGETGMAYWRTTAI